MSRARPMRLQAEPGIVSADDPDRYRTAREALAALPMSVVIVGAANDRHRSCATGTAMYVSFAPARLAIALRHPGSRTAELVDRSGRFSVSVLAQSHLDCAMAAGRSSSGGLDKFAALGLPVIEGPAGTPALASSTLVMWCDVVSRSDAGDHILVVGEVTAYEQGSADSDEPALVRHRRRFATVGEWLTDEAPEGYPT